MLLLWWVPSAQAKEDPGSIILTPRGFWYSEISGDTRVGRDGLLGTRLDFGSRRRGLGLDTDKLASPYADLEFPGELADNVNNVASIKFWWLNYDGAARHDQDFLFNRTTFLAGATYVTEVSVLALEVRYRLDISVDWVGEWTFSPIVSWNIQSHDVKIEDPFDGTARDRKKIVGTYPAGGLRVTWKPVWWFGPYLEAVGVEFSWMNAFELAVVHVELRAGVLFRFSETWGFIVEYAYTRVELIRGRTSSGRSQIDGVNVGPAMSIYAKF